ncbi:PREDICTED: ribonuclease Oy [Nicrophorus vespilloides]|uniref:Ribonuclease Oy n=1 Tax=Nicrophorus vespilloides TaxID=110193 RepID=A0ABM1NCP1_NICVS|nr:PREDICTED: ribonuclease Oy [Nicrophorus vespilloides]
MMLLFCILCAFLTINVRLTLGNNNEWDLLIFTQHWPITVCTEWQESKVDNECRLPPKKNLWTVHGVWPTRMGTIGPAYCNNSWPFEPKKLSPILNELQVYWINIEANTPPYSFWQHEWSKHGTCAAELDSLNNELNYFKTGLQWIQLYGMGNILAKANIKPDSKGYNIYEIYGAIKKLMHKNPVVECVWDKKLKALLLSEIRICFDKKLTLIDCDGVKEMFENVKDINGILTNCDPNQSIMYYNKVPVLKRLVVETESSKYYKQLLQLYNTIQYLIWFTF